MTASPPLPEPSPEPRPSSSTGLLVLSALVLSACSLALAVLVAEITESVLRGERATTVDATVHELVAEHRTAWVTDTMGVLTHLADPAVVVLVTAVVALLAWNRHRPRLAAFMVAATAVTGLLVTATKVIVARPRPATADQLITVAGAAFPSGHAAQSLACYVAVALVAARMTRSRSLGGAAVAGALVLAFVVGASRVYLGVHWTSDVVAGWALAAGWLAALVALLLVRRALDRRDRGAAGPVNSGGR